MALPDGRVGEEVQQHYHQGTLHHDLGVHKRQVSGDPTFYDDILLLQLLTLALAGSLTTVQSVHAIYLLQVCPHLLPGHGYQHYNSQFDTYVLVAVLLLYFAINIFNAMQCHVNV